MAKAASSTGRAALAAGLMLLGGMVAAAVGVGTALATASSAAVLPMALGPTKIDFDDLSVPSLFRETVRLTDAYKRRGVIFAGPGGNDGMAVLTEAGNFYVTGHSPHNFLAWNDTATMSDGGTAVGPERLEFGQPVSNVSIRAGRNEGGTGKAIALDSSGRELGVATLELSKELKTMSLPYTSIAVVVLEHPEGFGVYDDLVFTLGRADTRRPGPTGIGTEGRADRLRPILRPTEW